MSEPVQRTRASDRGAIALSVFCLVHCLVLPVIAVSAPFLATFAEAEIVHQVAAALAIAISASVPIRVCGARVASFLVPAVLGAFLLGFGLFSERFGIDETVPTVIGGLLLAVAHAGRLIAHR